MSDIDNALSSTTTIKNGTVVVSCLKTGEYKTQDDHVINTPILSAITDKYNNRYDDPSYYYGDGTQGT